MNKKSFIWIIVCLILVSYVSGLGLSPSKLELFFEENTKKESYFRIINNENKDLKLSLFVRGDLAKYVELGSSIITIPENEPEAIIRYTVNYPSNLKPGVHKVEILAVENENTVGNILLANIGLVHQVNIRVPYPDQYLEGTLFISETRPNEKTTFTVSLYNVGTKDIEKIKGSIIISGSDGQPVLSIKTNEISLKAGQKSKITGEWIVNLNPGTYNAKAMVEYDNDKILVLEKDFDIGEPLIDIDSLSIGPFKLGTIAKFDISLSNKWNQDMLNIFADTEIRDDKGVLVETYRTSSVVLPSLGSAKLSSYWDTSGIEPGIFVISVKVHYLGRLKEKYYEMDVKRDEIIIKSSLITGEVVKSQEGLKTGNAIVILILGSLFLLLLVQIILKKISIKNPLKKDKLKSYQKEYPELRKYIKTKLSQGYSRDSIRKSLEEKGWNIDIIDYEMMKAEEDTE